VAAHIRPSVRVFSFEHTEALRVHFAQLPFYLSLTIKQTCESYLNWTAMQGSRNATPLALPAPYDPLIRMYEQGGHFYFLNGFLYVAWSAVSVGSWRKYDRASPIVELSDFPLSRWHVPAAAGREQSLRIAA